MIEKIAILKTDITTLAVDAIVNAANSSLLAACSAVARPARRNSPKAIVFPPGISFTQSARYGTVENTASGSYLQVAMYPVLTLHATMVCGVSHSQPSVAASTGSPSISPSRLRCGKQSRN